MNPVIASAMSVFMLSTASAEAATSSNTTPPIADLTSNNQISQPLDDIPEVIGGVPASAAELPYQAMLVYQYSQVCGGTLIDSEWVLTAAHCVDRVPATMLSVRLGGTQVSRQEGQEIPVAWAVIHPYWRGEQFIQEGWDVALLKLAHPAPARYKVAKLPNYEVLQATTNEGQYGLVSGWGATYFGQQGGNDQLMMASLPFTSQEYCSQQMQYPIPSSTFCTGYTGGATACNGDSGGPFVTQYQGDVYSVGIVSWGKYCSGISVFTSTFAYKDWILSNIRY